MPSDCNGVSCFQQIFEKNLDLPLKFGYFHFSVSSSILADNILAADFYVSHAPS